MLIPLKLSMERRQVGCPGSCAPGCVPARIPLAPCSPGSCSPSSQAPQPGLWCRIAGWQKHGRGSSCSQVGSLAVAFLWKFSFLYKNRNSSGKIKKTLLFTGEKFYCPDWYSLCFVFACALYVYEYDLMWKVSSTFTLKLWPNCKFLKSLFSMIGTKKDTFTVQTVITLKWTHSFISDQTQSCFTILTLKKKNYVRICVCIYR